MLSRRHHCRMCGDIFCNKCCPSQGGNAGNVGGGVYRGTALTCCGNRLFFIRRCKFTRWKYFLYMHMSSKYENIDTHNVPCANGGEGTIVTWVISFVERDMLLVILIVHCPIYLCTFQLSCASPYVMLGRAQCSHAAVCVSVCSHVCFLCTRGCALCSYCLRLCLCVYVLCVSVCVTERQQQRLVCDHSHYRVDRNLRVGGLDVCYICVCMPSVFGVVMFHVVRQHTHNIINR